MIAVPSKTFSRLVQARARLEVAMQLNPNAYPESLQDRRVSMATLISYLLDLRDADLKRRARNKKREGDQTDIVGGEAVV